MTLRVSAKLAARCLTSFATVFLFAIAAYGQDGSITGTIKDPSGATIANVAIEAKNVDTGATFKGGTSATGNYVIPVPAGTYQLTVTASGFKKYVRSNWPVSTASDSRLDVTLEVGAVTDTITVNEQAPLLKTESGEMAQQLNTKDINELPILTLNAGNIRDPLQEISVLPGASYFRDAFGGSDVVINGLPANSESIRIEGQDSTSNIWKIAQQNSQAGVDAIQEVAIQTSNFAAEFGQAAGGYINYTMKSGTNAFHGSGYNYLANEGLNAGLPFTDRCVQDGAYCLSDYSQRQHIRNRVRRDDYGFTFGGPVWLPKLYNGKNKTFFFTNFEQYRQQTATSTGLISTPTAAYRNGNFQTALCSTYVGGAIDGTGGTCTPYRGITLGGAPAVDPAGTTLVQGQIFDPYSTRFVNGTQVRTPFPNNTIPATQLDPVALAVQKMMPVANNSGDVNNYSVPTYINYNHTTNLSFKFDQNISSTIKMSAYYSQINTIGTANNGLPAQLAGAPTNQWNHTTRVNYDQSIRPTLLFHIGLGYFQTSEPHLAPAFDQSTIGLKGYSQNQIFPDLGGVAGAQGGYSGSLGATFSAIAYEEKPTATTNLTWVHGNHTFKAGGEYTGEGYPTPNDWRANGNFVFGAAETANPWQNGLATSVVNPTGFVYASFLTGLPDSMSLNQSTDSRLGYHSVAFYLQDSWKVNKKLTLDYGLRWDYQTYMREQYGRMQDASFGTMDTKLGRPGAVVYGASCNCDFSHNYPYAWGPRLGAAYQLNTKTVLRGGAGIQYDVAEAPNGVLYSAADYYQINPNGYGISPLQNTSNPAQNGLQGGNAYAVGNPFGNAPVVWPNLDPNKYPYYNNGIGAPGSPFVYFDPNNRPGRVFTWSIAVQRQITKTLVVEAAYVGNRGAYFPSPTMGQMPQNPLTPQYLLQNYGIDFNNAADRALLTQQVSSAAVQARFPNFKTVLVNGTPTVPAVYNGFPATQTLLQALRPVPQWGSLTPWLGPSLGKTWYDSMQIKVTKRYSHGLQANGNFTWAKADVIGSSSDSTYFLGNLYIGDVFNYANNKQVNSYVRPLAMTITLSYTTPKIESANKGMRVASEVVRGWQLGAVLRYQSGAYIGNPSSLNLLTTQLARSNASNFWNLTGQNRWLISDPNCRCFNPQQAVVLNTGAWTDAPAGTWSTSAPLYTGFRWQRQPAESMSFARNFRMGKEGKYNLQVRGEFQNIFNRTFLSAPSLANPNLAVSQIGYAGQNINFTGFGTINTYGGAGAQPRNGQAIMRFTF